MKKTFQEEKICMELILKETIWRTLLVFCVILGVSGKLLACGTSGGGAHIHVTGGGGGGASDELIILLLLSSTTTTTICLLESEEDEYTSLNYEQLREESAQGKGENLILLAHFFGCSKNQQESFSLKMQDQYSIIFSEEKDQTKMFIPKVWQMIQAHDGLQANCKKKFLSSAT